MTDFEFFSSAAYQFMHTPEVATLRAHYVRHGKTYGDISGCNYGVIFKDLNGDFMFEVFGEDATKRAQKMIAAAMA